MSISCSCDVDREDAAWFWIKDDACTQLKTKRSRKCCSCKTKLNPGDMALIIERWRRPDSEVEDRIYGEDGEIKLADWHSCPYCASIANIVSKHGACYDISSDIQDQIIEHITDGESCQDGQDPAAVLLHDLFFTFVGRLEVAA